MRHDDEHKLEHDGPRGSDMDAGLLDGGEVGSLDEPPLMIEQHRVETARYLAFGLVSLLGATIVSHYGLTALFVYQERLDAIPHLDKTFNVVMPLLSGLVGAAATYFFTRGRK